MVYVILSIGYLALIGYLVYQAVMLDNYHRQNAKLRLEVENLKPPF